MLAEYELVNVIGQTVVETGTIDVTVAVLCVGQLVLDPQSMTVTSWVEKTVDVVMAGMTSTKTIGPSPISEEAAARSTC